VSDIFKHKFENFYDIILSVSKFYKGYHLIIMATFHKPKVFRSIEGCCICKTKSSSSRFTDSSKYEDQFQNCFKLEEERVGEICNACVLLVKRWKKLPKNTKRDWSHVVDARAGPGAKNFVKQKKKDDNSEEFVKIRRKVLLKSGYNREISDIETGEDAGDCCTSSSEPMSTSSETSNDNAAAARLQQNQICDFFDSYYWKRDVTCCGPVFRGMMGEIMLDTRSWSRCPAHSSHSAHSAVENNNNKIENNSESDHMTVEGLIESELRKLTSSTKSDAFVKETDSKMTDDVNVKLTPISDHDEGFCDKSSTVTGPSSPDSANLVLEDE